MTVARYRDQVNRAILIAALERGVERGLVDDYRIKGGAAIELRFGMLARSTRDLDVELSVPLAALRDVFAALVADPVDDFTLDLLEDVRAVREDAVRVKVSMRYVGQAWATLDVDLAPSDPGISPIRFRLRAPRFRC